MSKANNRMNRITRRAGYTAALAAAACTAAARAQIWTGNAPGGGFETSWSLPANWSTNQVPTYSANVGIGTGFASGKWINMGGAPRVVNSISFNTLENVGLGGSDPLNLYGGGFTRVDVAGIEPDLQIWCPLILGADGVFNINGSGTTYISAISGAGRSLTKTGSGVLTMNYAATYTGSTTISGGILDSMQSPGNGVVTVNPGGTLQVGYLDIGADWAGGTLNLSGYGAGGGGALRSMWDGGAYWFDHMGAAIVLKGDASIFVTDALKTTGSISQSGGTFALVKTGPGLLNVEGAGTYTGGTIIGGGSVRMGLANSLGTGQVIVNVNSAVQTAPGVAPSNALSLGNNATLHGVGDGSGWNGPITLQANAKVHGDGATTFAGNITDGALSCALDVTSGNGSVTLLGNNTYDGGTNVGGNLIVFNNAALGSGPVSITASGALRMTGNTSLNRAITLNSGGNNKSAGGITNVLGSNTLSGSITLGTLGYIAADAGTLTIASTVGDGASSNTLYKMGAGKVILAGAGSYDGGTMIQKGVLNTQHSTALGTGLVTAGQSGAGVLEVQNNISVNNPLLLKTGPGSPTGTLRSVAGNNTWLGPITIENGNPVGVDGGSTLQLAGAVTAAGPLTKVGAGALALSNNATNVASIEINTGAVNLTGAFAAPAGTPINVHPGGSVGVQGGYTMLLPVNLSGSGQIKGGALRSLSGNNAVNGPITLIGDGGAGVDSGSTLTINSAISDNNQYFELAKYGPGTLVLAGTNTYTGGTAIHGGTVKIAGNSSLGEASAPVTIDTGAKLLVSGNLSTARSFEMNNGSIEAGTSANVTYAGSSISGGYLRGSGTHLLTNNTAVSGVTIVPGAKVQQSQTVNAANMTNSGALTNSGVLYWDGGVNTASGTIDVYGLLTTNNFANDGVLNVKSNASYAHYGSNLVSSGGSRINIEPSADFDLGASELDLNGGMIDNNGLMAGTINVHYGGLVTGKGLFGAVKVFSGGTYIPGGGAKVPVQTPNAEAHINPNAGIVTDVTPVSLLADTEVTVGGAGDSLTFTQPVQSQGVSIRKEGAGALNLKNVRAHNLNINAGALNVLPDGSPLGVVLVDGLNIAAGAHLDLADNDLVANNGSFEDILAKVIAGFGNPSDITSSTSDGHQILALFDNSLLGLDQWEGLDIGPNAIVGKYTFFGDANLDGQVTGDDYTVVDANLNTTPALGLAWLSGDVNLDGLVTGDDSTVIDANLGLGSGNPLIPSQLGAVPEPGAAVTALGSLTLLQRRRRRRSQQSSDASVLRATHRRGTPLK